MNNSVAKSGQEFWLKPALKKAETILAEGVIPLPEDHYLERFLVEEMQAKIEEQSSNQHSLVNKKLSVISEGLICDLINQGLILGPKARAWKANLYDDYINHIDLVVELDDCPIEYLAIDVTYSVSLDKKLNRIRNGISSGKLSGAKYVGSTSKDIIPSFLLGLDLRNLCVLGKRWIEHPDEIAHSEKFSLLRLQLIKQIEVYAKYASTNRLYSVAQIFEHLKHYWNKPFLTENLCNDQVTDIILTDLSNLYN